MNIFTCFCRVVLIVFLSLTFTAPFAMAQVVNIPDANLRARVEAFLSKNSGDAITKADMQTLTLFSAVNADIRDLTGLEHATNLVYLELDANAISDITPLTRLLKLSLLYLENNPLSAESVDKHIPRLLERGVDVSYTLLSDVNSDGIVNIQDLVSVTQHFGSAGDLTVDVNRDGIVNITDLTEVADDVGETTVNADTMDAVDRAATPLGETPARDEAFIFMKFIDQLISDAKAASPDLDDADFQPPGKGFYDPYRPGDLFLRPSNHHVLGTFIPDPITTVTLQQINNFSLEYKLRGEELTDLLRNLRHAKIWVVAVAYREIEMPDENLRKVVVAKINELGVSLGPFNRPKLPNDPIYAGEMWRIGDLRAEAAGIEDLTGLEYATSLKTLLLGNIRRRDWDIIVKGAGDDFSYKVTEPETPNIISNLSPLENLIELESLGLSYNAVSDLSPLRKLKNLKFLNLSENKITDIGPLANLTNLENLNFANDYYNPLWAGNNEIRDLTPLRNLRNLKFLDVELNPIGSSIGVVRHFPKLNILQFGCCGVSDLRPLVACPGLRGPGSSVYLVGNPLTDHNLLDILRLEDRGVTVSDLVYKWDQEDGMLKKVSIHENFAKRCLVSYRESRRAAPALQMSIEPDVLSSLWHDLSQVPEETALLPNYPNPFNPETWIPYQLALPTEVTVAIHAADGRLVRTLALGYQAAGVYKSKGRAVYWDGRNAQGEPVASGVYFYTLMTGDYTATRKLLIRK